MNTFTAFSVIVFAGLIHATFQLSISVLTLLSGHSLGKNRSHKKLFRLSTSFVLGSIISTLLLLSFATLTAYDIFGYKINPLVWAIVSGLTAGVGISVWLFYFRYSTAGTMLWLPRPISDYLNNRSKDTSNTVEAFALGVMGVLGEIIFIAAPIAVSALALNQLNSNLQFIALMIYAVIASLPLVAIWMLIGGGHKISEIQIWRENHKYFMQFFAGSGLIALAIFIFIYQVISSSTGVLL